MFEIAKLPREFFTLQNVSQELQQKCVSVISEILNASMKLGMKLQAQDFVTAWANGYKILVERDDTSREIIGVGLFICDSKFYDDTKTATVLDYFGNNYEGLIRFARDLAIANSAYQFIYDMKQDKQIDDNRTVAYIIKELI